MASDAGAPAQAGGAHADGEGTGAAGVSLAELARRIEAEADAEASARGGPSAAESDAEDAVVEVAPVVTSADHDVYSSHLADRFEVSAKRSSVFRTRIGAGVQV